MENKKTIIIVSVSVAAILGALWYFKKGMKSDAETIIDAGYYSSGVAELSKFDKEFLKTWAKAAKADEPTFIFNGITLNTKGGKLVVEK
jgi:hypothetical protein